MPSPTFSLPVFLSLSPLGPVNEPWVIFSLVTYMALTNARLRSTTWVRVGNATISRHTGPKLDISHQK
jgi:hypothetical protein